MKIFIVFFLAMAFCELGKLKLTTYTWFYCIEFDFNIYIFSRLHVC